MSEHIQHALRYVKAAPWPYMTGLGSLLLALGLKTASVAHWSSGELTTAAVFGWWGLCWMIVALVALADGISRHREYRRIKAMFMKYGFSERILKPLARSRCQRDAGLLAARETGHHDQAKAYFHQLGYRWYHILPDLVVRNPFVFVSPTFLRSSFLPGKKVRV
ncbi:hypothetical protein [Pseudodesulfovibrio sediminis]|uniref:hypothetical protein n=1 Tax=Pseudodesulfovibrio sediminis TaxID=2810563 RepID=UPI001E4461A0|nr:hypothetical protein [Pseudodesulfovibrio sediminis]